MITKVTIDQFKCFDHLEVELGNFNVLIGPNDAGKTAFLQALGIGTTVLSRGAIQPEEVARGLGFDYLEPLLRYGAGEETLSIRLDLDNVLAGAVGLGVVPGLVQKTKKFTVSGGSSSTRVDAFRTSYYRLTPSGLRQPSPITMGQDRPKTMMPSGDGFPTFLEEFLRTDRRGFFAMEESFHRRFPRYEVHVNKSQGQNVLSLGTRDGQELPVTAVSDGAVLYLAFLAITHQSGSKLLLLEEPENGVYYAALKEIVEAIRHACEQEQVQVVMTTHSPYLLDLVEPDEAIVFTKDENNAVQAKRLSEFPDVKDMTKHFMTGEIWTLLGDTTLAEKAKGT